jgi:glucosamine--fructose-6-phosphate aminotransferase (isomerizing)
MCGIFGIGLGPQSSVERRQLAEMLAELFVLSESRGKEAAGIAVHNGQGVFVAKEPIPASRFIKTPGYQRFLTEHVLNGSAAEPARCLAVIGHSRLVTNGAQAQNENNQPVVTPDVVGVHNGIIVNDTELWQRHPDVQRRSEVDSEVILALYRKYLQQTGSASRALDATFAEIDGVASVALLPRDQEQLLLATNNGSLYYALDATSQLLFFSSERFILEQLGRKRQFQKLANGVRAKQLEPNSAIVLDFAHFAPTPVEFRRTPRAVAAEPTTAGSAATATPANAAPRGANGARAARSAAVPNGAALDARENMRRCTACILPETFPFLTFDARGVCSVCRNYRPIAPLGRAALEERVARHRSRDGHEPDCIVSISGGRDSSFGLHYVKTELGMHPISFTYDWGLVNDLARRNISRLCGRLGVENILISADLAEKRANVRRNVLAWLRRPRLGMIPLFMAGDKQFFYHGNRLARQTGLELVFFFPNRLERTNFKSGFCGVDEGQKWYFNLGWREKLTLASFFGKEFLLNPSYLNVSLLDTAHAFYSTYFLPNQQLTFLFDYVPWDESTIMGTLRREYDWQVAADTEATWRIGDGTAAFYNYIYYTVAGFTEHDTFRSNQVREGLITRDRALELALDENQPREASLRQYADLIGFDWEAARRVIDAMPKLYASAAASAAA